MTSLKISLVVVALSLATTIWANKSPFHLKSGDLLFQDLQCGTFCDSVDDVTEGVDHSYLSHVGMVIADKNNHSFIIEAVSAGVIKTPLKVFLARSHDRSGKPRVIVGRLKKKYQALIPGAILEARKLFGLPYNASFIRNGHSYYCSELVYESFLRANHDKPLFHLRPMNFQNSKTGKLLPSWKTYFAKLHIKAPQGLPGNNPGGLSREDAIQIVYHYGELRHKAA